MRYFIFTLQLWSQLRTISVLGLNMSISSLWLTFTLKFDILYILILWGHFSDYTNAILLHLMVYSLHCCIGTFTWVKDMSTSPPTAIKVVDEHKVNVTYCVSYIRLIWHPLNYPTDLQPAAQKTFAEGLRDKFINNYHNHKKRKT